MSANRAARRRKDKGQSAPAAPVHVTKMPNLSGDERNCGNCKFCVHNNPKMYGSFVIIRRLLNMALLPEDETLCLRNPDERGKKRWGFCYQHEAKES